MGPKTLFLRDNDMGDELAGWGALLLSFTVPCSLSFLTSHICSSLLLK